MIDLPRVVVAGTRSGVGKTSVATGLMAALAARAFAVSNHKVGPDFIDPSYHALATGRPPRNLDVVLHGAERIAALFAHAAAGADIAVVEGVMGLFDGRGSDDTASTAHVARLLDAPVLLVVDAGASSRSVAAEVHGFATFDPRVRVAGIVLNRIGSDRHEQLVREACEPLGIPVVGALRRDDRLTTPSRHLGLVPAAERAPAARETVAALGAAVGAGVDLDAVLAIARSAPPLDGVPWDPDPDVTPPTRHARPRVAVAGGPAFTFLYTEHRELLAAAGAEVLTFDPTVDERLPAGTQALVLGGGFPETFVDELSANDRLHAEVRALAAAGAPIVAECGGLVYLCERLDATPLCGLLPATATFSDELTLGYRDAVAVTDSVIGPAGTAVRGHEFHRTRVSPRAGSTAAWRMDGRAAEGFVRDRVHASYLHPSWVSAPGIVTALTAAAATVERQEVAP